MIIEITKLVSIILAISLASERLVVFLKTLFPALSDKPIVEQPVEPRNEKIRRLTVMFVAFLAAWLTASFLAEKGSVFGFGVIKISNDFSIPCLLMGLLASGGSSFWTNILAYLSAVKDISVQNAVQKKIETRTNMLELKRKQQIL